MSNRVSDRVSNSLDDLQLLLVYLGVDMSEMVAVLVLERGSQPLNKARI